MPNQAPIAPLSPRASMRWPYIRRAVTDFAPRSLLEVGCGQGAVSTRLVRLVPTFVAVEPDEESFKVARSRLAGSAASVVNGTADDLPDGEVFDTVCAFEVLEHLEDEDTALQQWRDRLLPGGQLVLSVPAFQEKFGPWDQAVGHFRRYSPDELDLVLRRNGFRSARLDVYGWPLALWLETARNFIIERRPEGSDATSEDEASSGEMATRTAGSGRILQPGRTFVGAATTAVVWPFTKLQMARRSSGNGIVAVAYRCE